MEGYKTLLFSSLKVLFGALIAGGVMDESQKQVVLDNLDSIIGGGLVLLGVGDAVLRKLTTSPMGKLFK